MQDNLIDIENIGLDVTKAGDVISPLLFGHNLEITRRGIWSGLSAEMAANRKFAASENNQPKRWQVVGADSVLRIDTSVAYAGKQCARVDVPVLGTSAGLKQQHEVLAVQKGKSYAIRVWLKTENTRQIRMRFTGNAAEPILNKSFACEPGEWQLLSASFESHVSQTNCTLQITSQDAGTFWLGAVSVLPADAFHGMRRDVIALLKKIKPGCLRFPGGCYEEFYDWKDGLLPVDQRPPIGPTGLWFLFPDTDDYDSHEIGVDEFIALCREVKSEPAITVRMSERTPESAAAWVEYCNGDKSTEWGQLRIKRGHRSSYNVRWWFVGNEMFAFGRGDLLKPDGHALQSRLFSEAMKRVDPSVLLVPCTQFSNGVAWPDWNTPLMNAVSPLMQAGSVHQYMLDQIPLTTEAEYSIIIKSPASKVHGTLNLARELMDQYQPAGQKIGLVYDEWNLMWGRPGSVPAGLYVAGILNMLCREAQPLGLEMACYFMPVNEGAIKVTPLSAEFDTTGYVFELYKVHQGNRLLPMADGTPLDLCASLTPNGKRIYVTAVNDIVALQTVSFSLAKGSTAKGSKAKVTHLVPHSLQLTEAAFDRKEQRVPVSVSGKITVTLAPGEIARIDIDLE